MGLAPRDVTQGLKFSSKKYLADLLDVILSHSAARLESADKTMEERAAWEVLEKIGWKVKLKKSCVCSTNFVFCSSRPRAELEDAPMD